MGVVIEYGRSDRTKMTFELHNGPMTIEFTLLCTPAQTFMLFGEQAYGSRATVAEADPAADPMDANVAAMMCSDEGLLGLSGDEMAVPEEGTSDPISMFEELDGEGADITVHRDGSFTAVIVHEEGGTATVEVDDEGRLVQVEFVGADDAEGMRSLLEFDYGSRSTISLPGDYDVLAANVQVDQTLGTDGTERYTIVSSPQEPALDELDVRVVDWTFDFGFSDADEDPTLHALFPLAAGTHTSGNFTFRFTDADSDGRLSAGDYYVMTGVTDPESFGFPEYMAVLYDKEAGAAVNSFPEELAPSPVWLALAGLAFGLAWAARRR